MGTGHRCGPPGGVRDSGKCRTSPQTQQVTAEREGPHRDLRRSPLLSQSCPGKPLSGHKAPSPPGGACLPERPPSSVSASFCESLKAVTEEKAQEPPLTQART